jgi:hypothetical protein
LRWKHCIVASVPLGFSEVTRGKALVTLEVLKIKEHIVLATAAPKFH